MKFFTKSLFKKAMECPTKLYYTNNSKYAYQDIDNPFIEAIKEGGYQVGELAKLYFKNGIDLSPLDYENQILKTKELLLNNEIILYEAAVCFKNSYVRTDIINKINNNIELIEVKSSSYDVIKDGNLLTRKGEIKSEWKEYLLDIAFQTYIFKKAYPQFNVVSFLMLVDKNVVCPSSGLNQKFKIIRNNSNKKYKVESRNIVNDDLTPQMLVKIDVTKQVNIIFNQLYRVGLSELSFNDMVDFFAEKYVNNEKIISEIGAKCKNCEFHLKNEKQNDGLLHGFKECWKQNLKWKDIDFEEDTVLDIWNFRGKQKLLTEGKVKLSNIIESDIDPVTDNKPGLSLSQRQWLQISKYNDSDSSIYIDKSGIKDEMRKWIFPLHFIDFETSCVAIPFYKGRKPYEGIAFQFSHHVMHKDGEIEHFGEFICSDPGKFPNYQFIRELKNQLSGDNGSIFRYSHHENTYLNTIYQQLIQDDNVPDLNEIVDFIKNISKNKEGSQEKWYGERSMIDLEHIVKRYYYNPMTKGLTSMKKMLPAILNSSKYLQEKYSEPIYGAKQGIKSLNFKDWSIVEKIDNSIIDPYKRLPNLFNDISDQIDLMINSERIDEGGMAAIAFSMLQFCEMTDYERNSIRAGLLRYCELDTLAMALMVEYFYELAQ